MRYKRANDGMRALHAQPAKVRPDAISEEEFSNAESQRFVSGVVGIFCFGRLGEYKKAPAPDWWTFGLLKPRIRKKVVCDRQSRLSA